MGSDRRILLAIDPGKLTGFVVLNITDYKNTHPSVLFAEELDQQTTASHIHWWTAHEQDVEVVMEDFVITSQTGKKSAVDTRIPLELIGVARYFTTLYKKSFTLQKPAEAMSFVDNDRIRDLGLWVKGGEGHHKDAMRHAILYMVRDMRWKPEGLLGS